MAATIPVALLLAVIITVLRGESANLLSIGAIDLGIIVDATVIMVENIFRHLAHHTRRAIPDKEARLSDKLRRVLAAAVEVDKAIFFSVIITIAAFMPLFTMQGVEGQIFGPMARTYAYALTRRDDRDLHGDAGAGVGAAARQDAGDRDFPGPRHPQGLSGPAAAGGAQRPDRGGDRGGFLLVVFVLGARLGTEFLPKLEEGNLWIRAVMPPTITLEAGAGNRRRIRKVILEFAPVQTVASEQGRGDDATDPDGSFLAEFFVPLKPQDEWPKGLTKINWSTR